MPAAADQIEQIAVLAGCGIAPFAGGAGAALGTAEAHIETAPRRVIDIAGDPVTAALASVREIMAAYRLGLAREAARQIAYLAGHGSCPDQAASARERTAIRGW